MKFYITGTRRGLGKALEEKYGNCETLEDCDIFINCKHDGFKQVEMLHKANSLGKRIINIGSHASDYTHMMEYSVEKKALREANHFVFSQGGNTTCVNFGYIDTESQAHKNVSKMSIQQAISVIDWILTNELKIKDITVTI